MVAASYDALAAEYAKRFNDELAYKPLDRALLDQLAEEARAAGPVLDVGCGPGHVARYLHDRHADVTGLDLSSGLIGEARRLHPEIRFDVGDMRAMPYSDGSFAAIVAFYAIVHLSDGDLVPVFAEMRRVLRPAGSLLVSFHVGADVIHHDELWGIAIDLTWRFVSLDTVTRALSTAGFEIVMKMERAPVKEEHPSLRGYVWARAPR